MIMRKQNIPIIYGFGIAVMLSAYFLILALFGLHVYPAFSFFNAVITSVGIFLCIRAYKRNIESEFNYQDGFTAGLTSGFIASILFTLFFGVYATHLQPDFLEQMDIKLINNFALLLFIVAIMGFATTLVVTLTFMQLFKNSWNAKKHPVNEYKKNHEHIVN